MLVFVEHDLSEERLITFIKPSFGHLILTYAHYDFGITYADCAQIYMPHIVFQFQTLLRYDLGNGSKSRFWPIYWCRGIRIGQ